MEEVKVRQRGENPQMEAENKLKQLNEGGGANGNVTLVWST